MTNTLRKPIQTAIVPYGGKKSRLPAVLPGGVGDLDAYIRAANSAPVLSADEERRLAVRMREHNDVEAAQTLIISHLRLVISVARGYLGYGLSHSDLIQEGNIGLMKAVRHYDPDKGVRLMTFAVHWIRSEIQEFIVRNSRMVKPATTHAQRKLFFNLRGMKESEAPLTVDEAGVIAERLSVKPSEVFEMEKRLSGRDSSLDAPVSGEEEGGTTIGEVIASPSLDPEAEMERRDEERLERVDLRAAVASLDPRSRRIIEARWLAERGDGAGKGASLAVLAKEFGISIERVRQLEKQAIARLGKMLSGKAG